MKSVASKLLPITSIAHFNSLEALNPMIYNLREQLYNQHGIYPPLLCNTLARHYEERLKRADGNPMLGEYAVFLLGDLLAIDPSVVQLFSFPWLLMYEHCLLLDDLLDESRTYWKHELLLSQLLSESSQNEYCKLLGGHKSILEIFGKYRIQSINAMLFEIGGFPSGSDHFNNDRILKQGRKASLLKFCGAAMMLYEKNRCLSQQEEFAIDCLCAGVQLLDDLTDSSEDHVLGRGNALLCSAYDWLKVNVLGNIYPLRPSCIGKEELSIGIILSGAASSSWRLAANYLEQAVANFRCKDGIFKPFIRDMVVGCRGSYEAMDTKLATNTVSIQALLKSIKIKHSMLQNNNEIARLYEDLYSILKTGPKGSN